VLSQRATQLNVSPHQLARYYVLEKLQEREDREALSQAIVALQGQLATLHKHFRLAVQVLLHAAGRVEKEDARSWVTKNLREL